MDDMAIHDYRRKIKAAQKAVKDCMKGCIFSVSIILMDPIAYNLFHVKLTIYRIPAYIFGLIFTIIFIVGAIYNNAKAQRLVNSLSLLESKSEE